MKTTRSLWIKRLGVLALSMFIALLLSEFLIWSLDWDRPLIWAPDPELGWAHIPDAKRHWTKEGDGLIEINQLGYRDRQRTRQKPQGTFRIAVFGDSMTEAVQVNPDQTYCHLLEEKLSTADRPVEVLNFGVSGYSPVQELLLMKKVAPQYRPDLILLALFLDNDVRGCSPVLNVGGSTGHAPSVVIQDNGELAFDFSRAEASFADYQREPKHTARRLLGLYRLLYELKAELLQRRSVTTEDPNHVPQRYRFYEEPQRPEWANAWVLFERVLLEFVAEAKRQDMPVVLVSVPANPVVNDSAWERILELHPAARKLTMNRMGAETRLKKFAQTHGMELVQPLNRYEQASAGPELYFGYVGHFTAAGNALLADVLEEHLRGRDGAPYGKVARSD